MARPSLQVPIRSLRWRCAPSRYQIRSSDRTPLAEPPVGQDRVRAALELGLGLWGPGYNLFVAGPTGTGRRSTIAHLLRQLPAPRIDARDYAFGYNTASPDEPLLLTFPAGQARAFQRQMTELVAFLREQYPSILQDVEFQRERRGLHEHYAQQEARLRGELIQQAVRRRFRIAGAEAGQCWYATPLPLVEDRAVTMEELERLALSGKVSQYRLRRIRKAHDELAGQIERYLAEVRARQKALRTRCAELIGRRLRQALRPAFAELRASHAQADVAHYLEQIEQHIVTSCSALLLQADPGAAAGADEPYDPADCPAQPPYHRFEIQIVLDRVPGAAPPVVHETHPTRANLFGTVERGRGETDPADLLLVRPGSLLQADGGYLVLDAHELLQEDSVWQALKRTLQAEALALRGPAGVRPGPIPLRIKVILIGSAESYQQLCENDPDFTKVFKVLADFDQETPRTESTIRDYLSVVSRTIHDEGLPRFDPGAMAAMVESGARMAGRADRLTACFSKVANLAREAAFWARQAKSRGVGRRHVELATRRMAERHGQLGEKLQEQISDGFILLDLEGSRVGQVNALIVYEAGEHTYGVPCRISATAGPGEGPILNIERMADLSGPSHDKGVLILGGFLRGRYASDKPLCLSASVCFEQSYHEVDGDSASLGEVIALISALAGIPIRQDLALTGSINQQGEIQPVGEINSKIEGFYDVCRRAGLSGTQGVILPARNVPELMLRDDVVDAVRQGRFHIYGARHIDEVLQLITGCTPGARNGNGSFQRGTINDRVDTLLAGFTKIVANQRNGAGGKH